MEDAAKDYAAGVTAGLATVAVGHPFDTIKVNLQARNPSGGSHSSAIKCAGWIVRQDGVRGLYKGATSSFVGMAVESSLLFGIYSQTKAALSKGGGGADVNAAKLSTVVPSAALGGAIISMILCPTELIKCRLQVQSKSASGAAKLLPTYSGPLDIVRQTVRSSGIQGLFRGLSATFFRECAGNVCFFATYETSRRMMHSYFADVQDNRSRTLLEALVGIVSGGISGMAFWTAVLPFDVAKTRIQTAVDLKETRSLFFHLKAIQKELGFKGLYTGLGPTLLRAFPANAAAIVTWEVTAKLLGTRQVQQHHQQQQKTTIEVV